jgi:hypothetical protein
LPISCAGWPRMQPERGRRPAVPPEYAPRTAFWPNVYFAKVPICLFDQTAYKATLRSIPAGN